MAVGQGWRQLNTSKQQRRPLQRIRLAVVGRLVRCRGGSPVAVAKGFPAKLSQRVLYIGIKSPATIIDAKTGKTFHAKRSGFATFRTRPCISATFVLWRQL